MKKANITPEIPTSKAKAEKLTATKVIKKTPKKSVTTEAAQATPEAPIITKVAKTTPETPINTEVTKTVPEAPSTTEVTKTAPEAPISTEVVQTVPEAPITTEVTKTAPEKTSPKPKPAKKAAVVESELIASPSEITMQERVGLSAGSIWQYLAENGETSVANLVDALPEEQEIIQRSIGWLAQEDKITLSVVDQIETIALKG